MTRMAGAVGGATAPERVAVHTVVAAHTSHNGMVAASIRLARTRSVAVEVLGAGHVASLNGDVHDGHSAMTMTGHAATGKVQPHAAHAAHAHQGTGGTHSAGEGHVVVVPRTTVVSHTEMATRVARMATPAVAVEGNGRGLGGTVAITMEHTVVAMAMTVDHGINRGHDGTGTMVVATMKESQLAMATMVTAVAGGGDSGDCGSGGCTTPSRRV